MDYFTRYGLEFNPFIKNSKEIMTANSDNNHVPHSLYLGEAHLIRRINIK